MSTSPTSSDLPSIYSTSSSKKYSVPAAEATYFYIPPCQTVIDMKQPSTIDARTGQRLSSKLEIEWMPHKTSTAFGYAAIAISFILYYACCFMKQYGNYTLRVKTSWLDEGCLTRVVMIQWLIISILLITTVTLYKKVLMPIYIFLSVIATNGTLVLFLVRFKAYTDNIISIDDISLNLLGLLLFCAILHDIVYLYAMYLHLIKRRIQAVRRISCSTVTEHSYVI